MWYSAQSDSAPCYIMRNHSNCILTLRKLSDILIGFRYLKKSRDTTSPNYPIINCFGIKEDNYRKYFWVNKCMLVIYICGTFLKSKKHLQIVLASRLFVIICCYYISKGKRRLDLNVNSVTSVFC